MLIIELTFRFHIQRHLLVYAPEALDQHLSVALWMTGHIRVRHIIVAAKQSDQSSWRLQIDAGLSDRGGCLRIRIYLDAGPEVVLQVQRLPQEYANRTARICPNDFARSAAQENRDNFAVFVCRAKTTEINTKR